MDDAQKLIVEDKKRKALLDLAELFLDGKPELMIPNINFVVLKETLNLLLSENKELRAQVDRLSSVPIKDKCDVASKV